MKVLPIVIFSLIVTGCAVTSVDQNSRVFTVTNDWQTQVTDTYKGKRDDIFFVSPFIGWYGTGKGDLYQTKDGGISWQLVSSNPGTFIRALGFVNEQYGYIGNVGTEYYPGVSDENPLYRTDDGGQTLIPVDTGKETIKGICAIDVLKAEKIYQGELRPQVVIHAAGRVGGPSGILRSIDDGLNWEVIDMSTYAGMILDIKFFDQQTGLVFASTSNDTQKAEGLILRTTDGGLSWSEVYRSGRNMELVWKASFPTDQVGYATVQSYDQETEQQYIAKTVDGGKTWVELPMVIDAQARQFGIGFITETQGWVGTMSGGFYTDDGGETFSSAPVAKAANKFRVIPTQEGVSVFAIGTQVQNLKLEARQAVDTK